MMSGVYFQEFGRATLEGALYIPITSAFRQVFKNSKIKNMYLYAFHGYYISFNLTRLSHHPVQRLCHTQRICQSKSNNTYIKKFRIKKNRLFQIDNYLAEIEPTVSTAKSALPNTIKDPINSRRTANHRFDATDG
jgi:hypothetical protein